jgi:hypothetical protein
MKSTMRIGTVLLGAMALLQGCKLTVVENTPPPFPNAAQVLQRASGQKDHIFGEQNAGNLGQEVAQLLALNDDLILSFMREERQPSQGQIDLGAQQALALNQMLDDNDAFVSDAIRGRHAWDDYFQGEAFDYGSGASPYLYLTYLDHQLRLQERRVANGLGSGLISENDASEMKGRIQTVQFAKAEDYRSNGHLALSDDQVSQLSFMADDTARYIRFRLDGHPGGWDHSKFDTWRSQVVHPMAQGQSQGWSRNGMGGSGEAASAATAVQQAQSQATPAQAFSAGPLPSQTQSMPPDMSHAMVRSDIPSPQPVATQIHSPQAVQGGKAPAPRPALVITQDQLGQYFRHLDQNFQRGLKSGRISQAQAADIAKRLTAIHQKAVADQAFNHSKNLSTDQMRELSNMGSAIK